MVESWIAPLASDPEAAWDLFLGRYRGLIFGAIRRYGSDPDDVMDVFACVCEALRANDFARLRRCAARVDPGRPFSTFLVVVVHNLTIDWLRRRDGRRRLAAVAAALPPLRRRIFEHVFVEQRSHVESYELLRTGGAADLSFGEFLKELSATYQAVEAGRGGRLIAEAAVAPPEADASPADAPAPPAEDPAVLADRKAVLDAALETLDPDDRLAVLLYVVEEIPAEQVARALGFPSVKTVYNRVYRALAAIRARLERAGIAAGDL